MLMPLNKSLYEVKAINNYYKPAKLSAAESWSLQPTLQLSVMAKVMLLLNLQAEVSLCNETMPKVKSLIYKENVIQPCFSIAILRKFDNYNPTFYNTDLITI